MATKKKSKAKKRGVTRTTRKPASTPPAPAARAPEQDLETRSVVFIVNGHRTTLLVKASDSIQQHRDKVLADAGYTTQPEDWDTRMVPGGELVDVGQTFRGAQISHGSELTVSPRAGTQG